MYNLDTSSKTSRRRQNSARNSALFDREADLTSNDRAKQKLAVRAYLAEKVRNDWSFNWKAESQSINIKPQTTKLSESHGETVDFSLAEWREREDWLSNASENEHENQNDSTTLISNPDIQNDNPGRTTEESDKDCLEETDTSEKNLKKQIHEFRRQQKERLEEELSWNDGLRCFTARRNVWTCARVTSKPIPCSSFKNSAIDSDKEIYEDANGQNEEEEMEFVTEIPIGPPILPVQNSVRISITPHAYNIIYDKVVMNSITPTCPINLKDITRSCVQGWKRNGEWPPPRILGKGENLKEDKMANLFPQDESPKATNRGGKKEKKPERTELQGQNQRGRGKEREGNEDKEKRRGLSTCFNRILRRGS